ncbi:MAG: iron ABC transporter permease [Dehalococcoidia bacterium]|nr:iron ABC transporter permease [Dehalococcoidia bacterium]
MALEQAGALGIRRIRISGSGLMIGGAVVIVCFLAVVPLALLFYSSISSAGPGELGALTADNFVRAYSARQTYELLGNSVVYSLGTAILAFSVGSVLAWLCARTNMPLKGLLFTVSLVPMVVPGILNTISWLFLLSPRIGVINRLLMQAFGLSSAPFDVYSMGGMIWIEGVSLSPLVFLMMWAAFMSMDPSLEDSATMSGSSVFSTFRRVTLRLMLPAILSVVLITFIRGLESFEVPALVGLPNRIFVFTSAIYAAIHDIPVDYGMAGAYSVSLLVLSVVGVYLYGRATRRQEQFSTVTGKGYRPREIDLGPWKYAASGFFVLYFLVVVGFPLLILLWNSLVPYTAVPSLELIPKLSLKNYADTLNYSKIRQVFTNSGIAAFSTAAIVTLLTAVISWVVVKTRTPGRHILDSLAFIPIAIPGLALGVGLMWVYLTLPIPIYGTLWIMVVAYITRFMPYGMRTNSAAMIQIHRDMEEASSSAGASWSQTFVRVTLPLLRPALLTGFIYVALISLRELSSSIMLYSPGNEVLSIMIWDLWGGGEVQQVASLGIMMVGSLSVLVFFFQRLGGNIAGRL